MYHFSFSFYYLISNVMLHQAFVKTPGKINIADFRHFAKFPCQEIPARAPGNRILKPLTINKGFLPFFGVWEFWN